MKQTYPKLTIYLWLFVFSLLVSWLLAYFYYGFSVYPSRFNAAESIQVGMETATSIKYGIAKEEIKNWDYIKRLLFFSAVIISSLSTICMRLVFIKKRFRRLDILLILFSMINVTLFIILLEMLNFAGGV